MTFDSLMGGRSDVFFVQVGAHDGVVDDPIRSYVLSLGWRGVLVEPLPDVFARLLENYRGVTGLEFVNAAVTPLGGSVGFYRHRRLPQCSGLSVRTRLQGKARDRGEMEELVVEGVSMGELLGRYPRVDLLQIDVEGHDGDLVRAVPWGVIRPAVIRFEVKHLGVEDLGSVEGVLRDQGYQWFVEGPDLVAYLG